MLKIKFAKRLPGTHRFRILCALLGTIVVGLPLYPAASGPGVLKPTGLKCEWQVNPRAINSTRSELSWALESSRHNQWQTAYQILVASSMPKLAANNGDLWNSGKVDTSQTLDVR